MRFAPGVRPTPMPTPMANNPRQVNPRQVTPGVSNPTGGPKPAPMPMAGTRPMGPAPMTGGPKPMPMMKKGGKVKASSASKRADGIAVKGKTRGRIV